MAGDPMARRLRGAAAALTAIGGLTGATASEPRGELATPLGKEEPRPVRNETARPADEVLTIRLFRIEKGTFPEFLKESQEGVWPFFEKLGARIVGMWQVVPGPGSDGPPADYDEVYLMTRYASVEHWAATREASKLGGNGPDYEAMRKALAARHAVTISTEVVFLKGFTGPNGPYYMPGTGERFVPAQ